jgi:GTP-binding protein
MNFVDEVEIHVMAGDGGRGCVSFRHEKFVPKGGPDGGDGGDGGNVVLKVNPNLNTLSSFRKRRIYRAVNGAPGMGANRHGKSGKDLVIPVPPGTEVKDKDTGAVLADLTQPGEEWVAARGGKGGLGNSHFVSATRQAPRYAQPGLPGEERHIVLELKLLADVGLVGLPNAGKSTLLSVVTSARPKIANYPFTTLVPQLGVVDLGDDHSFVIADIPGLIEGAHTGTGMGIEFLRHIERTKVLLFVVDVSDEDPCKAFLTVWNELERFHRCSSPLTEKPFLIALNKMDIPSKEELQERLGAIKKLPQVSSSAANVVCISAATHENIAELLKTVQGLLSEYSTQSLDAGQDGGQSERFLETITVLH